MRRIPFTFFAFVLAVSGARADEVHQIPRAEVDAAFARGAPLLETESYKVHASRRDAPGMAEIHELDTDILYVREGRATFVTGGSVVDPREVAAHEIRGSAIANGFAREIGPG